MNLPLRFPRIICFNLFLLCSAVVGLGQGVSNVRVEQRVGTKTVDVYYDLSGSGLFVVSVEVSSDGGSSWASVSLTLSGDLGDSVATGVEKHIVWNAGADWVKDVYFNAKVRISADIGGGPGAVDGMVLIDTSAVRPFSMGSPSVELGNNSIETQHEVTLTRDFYMGQTEVTWAQWNEVRDWAVANGYSINTGRNGHTGDPSGTHPVTEVIWYEVVKWLNAKSEMEDLTLCYTIDGVDYKTGELTPVCDFSANGYRLPTEAEWEYACRAGTTTAFYTGDTTYTGSSPLDPNLDLAGWYSANSGSNTHPVAGKQKNAWELYDMHGNVREWCWDWYRAYTGNEPDPTGAGSGSIRVGRGGGWDSDARRCRSANRFRDGRNDGWSSSLGFRLTRSTN